VRSFTVELTREDDGRWIADVLDVAGAMAYGDTPESAAKAALLVCLEARPDLYGSTFTFRYPNGDGA
jgi:predicted RNase H-like HicB family nuclease